MPKRVTSVQEFFDTLSERFVAGKAEGVNATYQFELAGEGGGTWTATVRDKTISVSQGPVDKPSVKYKIKASDYVDLVNGDLGGVKAVFTRKLKVSGSIPLAKKMNDFLPPGGGK